MKILLPIQRINPLSAGVALIEKPVNWFDWFIYEGNTGT